MIRRWGIVGCSSWICLLGLLWAGFVGATAAKGAASTATLTSAPNPAIFGAPVTLTATVAPAVATGQVTFYDGTTVLGVGSLVGGTATLQSRWLPAGTRSLRAFYWGDANYLASMSGWVTQTVNAQPADGFLPAVGYGAGTYPESVAVGDFNGDGKADLAVANHGGNNVSVLLGNGNGTFQAAVNYAVGRGPIAITVGDFNGDGKADLAVANLSVGNVSVLLGNGNGTFQAAVNYAAASGSQSVAAGDFNEDGKTDLAVANWSSDNVSVLLGNGNGTFQAAVNYAAGDVPDSVTVADFNGDGKADLAVANYLGSNVSVLLGNGNGTFQAAVNYWVSGGPYSVAAGDFNGDGKADLAVANHDSNNVNVRLGNGDGTFQAAVNYGAGASPGSVAVGDFNGDGRADLATANSGNDNVSVLLGTGGTAPFATVSAASFTPSVPLAPGVIAAGYGTNLVSTIEAAPATGSLPTVLAQTSVTVRDSAGVERTAPLWFVSPSQIIYYIPDETALGQATITVVRNTQTTASGTLQIERVAPGLFTMNANGQGVPAALAIFVKPDESQTWQYVFNAGCQAGSCQPAPLDLSAATDTLFLQLYGTGIRGRNSLAAVTAKIGGVDAAVEYADAVPGMIGLDQVNLRVPRSLVGRGQVDILLTVDGKTANAVRVNIK